MSAVIVPFPSRQRNLRELGEAGRKFLATIEGIQEREGVGAFVRIIEMLARHEEDPSIANRLRVVARGWREWAAR